MNSSWWYWTVFFCDKTNMHKCSSSFYSLWPFFILKEWKFDLLILLHLFCFKVTSWYSYNLSCYDENSIKSIRYWLDEEYWLDQLYIYYEFLLKYKFLKWKEGWYDGENCIIYWGDYANFLNIQFCRWAS